MARHVMESDKSLANSGFLLKLSDKSYDFIAFIEQLRYNCD